MNTDRQRVAVFVLHGTETVQTYINSHRAAKLKLQQRAKNLQLAALPAEFQLPLSWICKLSMLERHSFVQVDAEGAAQIVCCSVALFSHMGHAKYI